MSKFETPEDREAFRADITRRLAEMNKAVAEENDETFRPESESYSFAAILVGGLLGIADDDAIAEAMAFDVDFVRTVGARLRANSIWEGSEYVAAKQLEERGGEMAGIVFSLHMNVAMGRMAMTETGGFFSLTFSAWAKRDAHGAHG